MDEDIGVRLRLERCLGSLLRLAAVTLVWNAWNEIVLGVDPHEGSGAVE